MVTGLAGQGHPGRALADAQHGRSTGQQGDGTASVQSKRSAGRAALRRVGGSGAVSSRCVRRFVGGDGAKKRVVNVVHGNNSLRVARLMCSGNE